MEKDKLQMNQYKMKWRKKREKDVRIAIPWSLLKSQCPFIRCLYCGKKGSIKKRCLQLELHKAIQVIKEIETEGETNGKVKKIREKNKLLEIG